MCVLDPFFGKVQSFKHTKPKTICNFFLISKIEKLEIKDPVKSNYACSSHFDLFFCVVGIVILL